MKYSSTFTEAESAFKHKIVYFCKNNLNEKNTTEEHSQYITHPVFLYWESSMKDDALHTECFEWTRQLFFEFYDSYECIARNILLTIGYYLKWHPKGLTAKEKMIVQVMCCAVISRKNNRIIRFAAMQCLRHIVQEDTVKILGDAFNTEYDDFLRNQIKSIIQILKSKIAMEANAAEAEEVRCNTSIMNKVEFTHV